MAVYKNGSLTIQEVLAAHLSGGRKFKRASQAWWIWVDGGKFVRDLPVGVSGLPGLQEYIPTTLDLASKDWELERRATSITAQDVIEGCKAISAAQPHGRRLSPVEIGHLLIEELGLE